jgi:hypothetical protein
MINNNIGKTCCRHGRRCECVYWYAARGTEAIRFSAIYTGQVGAALMG